MMVLAKPCKQDPFWVWTLKQRIYIHVHFALCWNLIYLLWIMRIVKDRSPTLVLNL